MTSSLLSDWREGLDCGDLSPLFLAMRCHERMDKLEARLNATVYRDPEASFAAARQAEVRLSKGERGPMLGIPIVLKDNLNWKGGSHPERFPHPRRLCESVRRHRRAQAPGGRRGPGGEGQHG